jgi:hypothetical protein
MASIEPDLEIRGNIAAIRLMLNIEGKNMPRWIPAWQRCGIHLCRFEAFY